MDGLVLTQRYLPDNIADLSKFVVIGTEKLVAMKAEIRAITKCGFAKEVYEQKMGEQRMLSELILDATVKIGELTKAMPKAIGGDRKSNEYQCDSGVGLISTKTERISELGFSPKQVERFEILANNKDIVEQVKAEARENDDIPTRSRVIELVKQRKPLENNKSFKEYLSAVYSVLKLEIDDSLTSFIRTPIADEVKNIDSAIAKLNEIKMILITKGGK